MGFGDLETPTVVPSYSLIFALSGVILHISSERQQEWSRAVGRELCVKTVSHTVALVKAAERQVTPAVLGR